MADRDSSPLFPPVQLVASRAVSLLLDDVISRTGTPHVAGYYILHEGMIGELNGSLQEVKYSALAVDKSATEKQEDFPGTHGWLGFTDKYWLTALVPPQDAAINAHFRHTVDGVIDRYQADYA